MPLKGLHKTDYEESLKQTIMESEGEKTRVYSDGVGVPTIAAGYSLIAHKDTWEDDFKSAGISMKPKEEEAFGRLIEKAYDIYIDDKLSAQQREKEVKPLISAYNKSP